MKLSQRLNFTYILAGSEDEYGHFVALILSNSLLLLPNSSLTVQPSTLKPSLSHTNRAN